MKQLRYIFVVIDLGFITYWLITALQLIPPQYLYNDYHNPILVHWNWSFFPLDILVSLSGLGSLYLHRRANDYWKALALLSLVLTSVSGLQAISYWIMARELDLTWWIPNLLFTIIPTVVYSKDFKTMASITIMTPGKIKTLLAILWTVG